MNGKPWTSDEDALLRQLYPDTPMSELVARFEREAANIRRKANYFGVHRSAEFLSREGGQIRKGQRVSPRTEFVKGQNPWNKGVSFNAGGRSAETHFKPGQVPPNTVPVGSYRITRDNTLQRKINNNPGSNSVRWRSVHELVWIEAHGPVPAGHRVVFKPGRKTTELELITLDAVECLSFADIMRRQSVHRLPKELAQLVQLRGAINRKLNRLNQETNNE